MTNMSAHELDEYLAKTIPTMYIGNGTTVGADLEMKCWYVYTTKYTIEWFWAGKTFRVIDRNSPGGEVIFSSPICGDLTLFCHMDDGAVLYCDAQTVDAFVERLLQMRVFL